MPIVLLYAFMKWTWKPLPLILDTVIITKGNYSYYVILWCNWKTYV